MIKPNIKAVYEGRAYMVANINLGGGYSWDEKDAGTATLIGEGAIFTVMIRELDSLSII